MSSERTRISIIGPSGKVGRETCQQLMNQIDPKEGENIELILIRHGKSSNSIGTGMDRMKGFLLDLRASFSLRNRKTGIPAKNITITNDMKFVKGSDIVIICCGMFPTSESKSLFQQKFPDVKQEDVGRVIQTWCNKQLIEDTVKEIEEYCPQTNVFIVTNQVDMCCQIARNCAKNLNIYGIGGSLDTSRFKLCLLEEIEKLSPSVGIKDIRCHVMGYHSGSMMFLLKSSLEIKGVDKSSPEIQGCVTRALKNAKGFGGVVSSLQKKHSDIDSGSSILPGSAIVQVIKSFCIGEEKEICLNVQMDQGGLVDHYGSLNGFMLQVPCVVKKGQVVPLKLFVVSEEEKIFVSEIQKEMKNLLEKIKIQE